jgi:hypothetical protein
MNANYETDENMSATRTFTNACKECGRKLVAQIEKAKSAVLAEFHDTLRAHEQMLHLALNEAEALAWQTSVPQLVFPTLAREKAQAVAAWQQRQEALRRA